MDEQIDQPDVGGVKSARRALVIMELLSKRESGQTFSQIQTELGYPKASLHALLRTLTDSGWVQFQPQGKLFVPGLRIWEAGMAYARMVPWSDRAIGIMEAVRNRLGETIQLAVLDGFEVLYIAKVDGTHALRLDSSVGLRLCAHGTGVGKALLAGLPDETVQAWLDQAELERYTDTTITEPSRLFEEIRRIRKLGYADDNQERTLGVSCVALGIQNQQGETVAAISVSVPTVRFDETMQKKALAELQGAVQEISRSIGPDLPARLFTS